MRGDTADVRPNPRVAVLIPAFRHPVLLAEAIDSVLAQRADFGIMLVLINDGCPFPETHQVCRDFALSHPDRITYIPKPNGGLSDARNRGIRHVLAHLPGIEAIFMLDADNLLRKDALARAMAELDAHPEADWIYPDIDMFGLDWSSDYGGDYSLLIHTEMNICEAGSLIRRRVFEAGVLFDTGFRLGWEDWDFFLTAASRGFRARNLEGFGFRYRKRPESMLANSMRDLPALTGAMALKHKALMRPEVLVALEQTEAPRYAIYLPDRAEVLCCTDPQAPGANRRSVQQYETEYWLALQRGGAKTVPPFTLVMSGAVLDGLGRAGLLHWVLWKLESMLQTERIAVLTLGQHPQDRLSILEGPSGGHCDAVVLAIGPDLYNEVLDDPSTSWIGGLARPDGDLPVRELRLNLPAGSEIGSDLGPSTAVFDFLSLVHRMRASDFRASALRQWDHRERGIPWRNREYQIVRKPFDGAVVCPRLKDGRRHIGFLLPLVEFGGVEKVALNMARGLKAQGWVPHAIVLDQQDAALSADWREAFESVGFLSHEAFSTWGGGRQDYLGTPVPAWAESGAHGPLAGMLHWLDAVVNFHGGAAAGAMGQLKRMGITTVNSLHLNDLTAFGRPVGNSYLGLAYEHAFDLFAPCSEQLGDWLHAMGVPRAKIVPVRNAPGFDLPAGRPVERMPRDPDSPLRVLYLGRLDRQKGLDRLTGVIRATRERDMALRWRVIGKAVVTGDAPPLDPAILSCLEPPLTDPADLAAAYDWADVAVLLSGYEGLPLTVLEGMRQGVVMLATDVGAVSEVLRDMENGLLLPPDRAVEGCLAALTRLSQDRALLARLSRQAQADSAGHDWAAAVKDLAARLDSNQ